MNVFKPVYRMLIGQPMHNQEMMHERLPKWKALSIFSSDALSSVAYGPEQAMLVLVAMPGLIAYGYLAPVVLAVMGLLAIVALSYVQVAKANPGGGGAYAIAKNNLGEIPALVAAGAVFADYVLTAAVSVSAGTDAIISAFPLLKGNEVSINLLVLFGILMLVNLRGTRESSNAFVFPTYAFLFGILALLIAGIFQAFTQPAALVPAASLAKPPLDWAMLFIILRAFANGCSSMTGVEAIADSVPLFKKPEAHNATITTYWMAGILVFMLAGISFLLMHYTIMPINEVTALSQIAEQVFGRGAIYYYIQITTMIVLYLAANTAYNGLPILMYVVAKDGYLPRYLGKRGDRLTFSNGIILLTLAAGGLTIAYEGKTEALISLYAIGVFLSFTIAQTSMVVHWRRERGQGWKLRMFLNGLGAVATGLVVVVVTLTKFMHGAWMVLAFIPCMVWVCRKIHSHYGDMSEQLHLPIDCEERVPRTFNGKNYVVIPVASPTRVVYETLKYARSISSNIIAVHVAEDEEAAERARLKWKFWDPGVELIVIQSPYRMLSNPLMDFIVDLEKRKNPEDYITVLIPEFETRKWWHRILHGQTGWMIRTMLILSENVIVSTIPYHLKK